MRRFFWNKIQDIYTVLDQLRNAISLATGGSGFQRTVTFLQLGLVADGITDNSLAFAEAQAKRSRLTNYIIDSTDNGFAFGPLPPEYSTYPLGGGEPIPAVINLDGYGATIRGEHMHASVIKLLPGAAGIYIAGGITAGVPTLDNFTIQGPGRGTLNDGRNEAGEWSQEHKHYKYGGIIANSQVMIDRVVVRDCSGEGMSVVGWLDITPTGVPIKFRGRLAPMEGDAQYFVFHPAEDPYGIDQLRIGWQVTVQGLRTNIPFNSTANTIYLNARPEMVAGGDVEIQVRPQGGRMIADCSTITRCWLIDNGGCGLYIQGDDGNQTRVRDNHFLGNGWMAYDDLSLLGSHFSGNQSASNGRNFNKWKGQNGWEGENEMRVPCWRLGGNDNASSTALQEYTEADQGAAYLGPRATCIGGEHAAGLSGPGYWNLGGNMSHLVIGDVRIDKYGMALRRNDDSQPPTYRFGVDGLPGFYYGNERTGSSSHAVLQLVRPGTDHQGARAHYGAVVVPELRIGKSTARQLSAGSLQEHLRRLAVDPAIISDIVYIQEATNGPQRYTCRTGGTADTCLFQPEGFGIGRLADRPAPDALTRHDIGYCWFNPATGTSSTFTGARWAAAIQPAPLTPLEKRLVRDNDPAIHYSPEGWNQNSVGPDAPYREGSVVTRSAYADTAYFDYYFLSRGQADEWVALHLIPDNNSLFAVFLNGEQVIARVEPDGPFLSHGERVVQHFQSTPFWNGDPFAFPACILQPAPGKNHLRLESYTPGGSGTNLFMDGLSQETRD